jgi:hypothetical protein
MPRQKKTDPLHLTDEELETVRNLAACNYGPERIAKYLSVDRMAFMNEWYDKDSDIRSEYDSGQMVAEFQINDKLRVQAEGGNITAAQIFQKSAEAIRIENIKQQTLFGGNEIEDEDY